MQKVILPDNWDDDPKVSSPILILVEQQVKRWLDEIGALLEHTPILKNFLACFL
jgi:hypothetical protein